MVTQLWGICFVKKGGAIQLPVAVFIDKAPEHDYWFGAVPADNLSSVEGNGFPAVSIDKRNCRYCPFGVGAKNISWWIFSVRFGTQLGNAVGPEKKMIVDVKHSGRSSANVLETNIYLQGFADFKLFARFARLIIRDVKLGNYYFRSLLLLHNLKLAAHYPPLTRGEDCVHTRAQGRDSSKHHSQFRYWARRLPAPPEGLWLIIEIVGLGFWLDLLFCHLICSDSLL
jgi:hypothetical protein